MGTKIRENLRDILIFNKKGVSKIRQVRSPKQRVRDNNFIVCLLAAATHGILGQFLNL